MRLRCCREESGILVVETSDTAEDDSVIEYDLSGRVCISRTPHLRSTSPTESHNHHIWSFRDFYEVRQVFVKESSIPFAGEGLWAKTDIKVRRKSIIASRV